ncbi:MAG: hypothetical protein LBD61_01045 [Endomicrobium sp.]|nr:hypothetical protein [Endomicrobium sp.]
MKKFFCTFLVFSIVFNSFVFTYAFERNAVKYHCEKTDKLQKLYAQMDSPNITNNEYEELLLKADKREKNFKKLKCQEEYYLVSKSKKFWKGMSYSKHS